MGGPDMAPAMFGAPGGAVSLLWFTRGWVL